jgi:alpha-galactosidase
MPQGRATVEVSGGRALVAAAGAAVQVDLASGEIEVSGGLRGPAIERASCAVELAGGRAVVAGGWRVEQGPRRSEDAHGRGARLLLGSEVAGARLLLELAAYDLHRFVLLRLGIEDLGGAPLPVERIVPLSGALRLAAAPARWRVFRHGWQSWTATLSLGGAQQDIDVRPPVHAPALPPARRGAFASEEVSAVLDPETGRSALLGFISARSQWTQVRVDAPRRAVEAVAQADGAVVRAGETLWSEWLLIEIADDAAAALGRYAEALGREMGARVPAAPPSGWCSWYYYYGTVTEADVVKNLRALEEHREALLVACVQIDDGYQAGIGDWTETNEKFPRGMAWLAREISAAGFTPGIWLAPFFVGASSRLFAEHPDWVIRGNDGAPVLAMRNWDQDCYGLDCTHPDAEAWLRELFHEITDRWGYDYLKIDFLYGAALAGRRHDASASRIEAYRRGLRAVREAVGERFVLGCGALMGASVGLVDGQRIGPDVAPWWRFNRPVQPPRRRGSPRLGGPVGTDGAVLNALTRSWMHGRLWANDPDCLLARSTRTKLTLPEVQSLATAIALSGGMVLASDDLTELSKERLDLISLLLPPLGEAPLVRDLMTADVPSVALVEVRRPFESWWLLGAFNPTGRRRTLTVELPPGRWHAFELWERRYHGERKGTLRLGDVPAHGVRLLALRRARARPQLLGSTFHISMGGREVEGSRYRRDTLSVALRPVAKQAGELFLHVPAGYLLLEARLDGRPLEASRRDRPVAGFRFPLPAPATFTARFERR